MAKATSKAAAPAVVGVTQAQLQALVEQNRVLMAQNQTLADTVASMGAQLGTPAQETAKLFQPKLKKVEWTDAERVRIADLYGMTLDALDKRIAEGKANSMANIDVRIDEKAGKVWMGFDYTHYYGVSQKGNHVLFWASHYALQVSHKLANGEELAIELGLPRWINAK